MCICEMCRSDTQGSNDIDQRSVVHVTIKRLLATDHNCAQQGEVECGGEMAKSCEEKFA